jgi:hypothetical protein
MSGASAGWEARATAGLEASATFFKETVRDLGHPANMRRRCSQAARSLAQKMLFIKLEVVWLIFGQKTAS